MTQKKDIDKVIKRMRKLPVGGDIDAVHCVGYDIYIKSMQIFYDLASSNYFRGDIIHIAEELEEILLENEDVSENLEMLEMAKNLKYRTFRY